MIFASPVRGPVHPVGWVRPAGNFDFRVSSPFGYRDLNGDGDRIDPGENHDGSDLSSARCNDPVFPIAPGSVVNAGTDTDGARFAIIDHGGGWRSYYWHLASVLVGTAAKLGTPLGTLGATGNASGCHLHLTIKHRSLDGAWVAVDPAPLLWQNEEAMTTITSIPLDPPRRVTINGPRAVQSYAALTLAKAGATSIGPAGSSTLADAYATIAPAPAWAPGGTVLHIPAGPLAGYIAHWRNSGTLLKDAPPPPAADCAAAVTARDAAWRKALGLVKP